MRFTGTLKTWNDARGFGFIEPAQGGQDLFIHIKDFPPGTGRPVVGQALTFQVETDPAGKKRARAVQYPVRMSRRPASEPPASWTHARMLAIPVFALVYGFAAWRWEFSMRLLLVYAALSLVTFFVYAFDKSAAVSGRRRTPEKTLHLFALAGGWPGALVAQQILRHKTRKQEFIGVFWLTVIVNIAAFLGWHAMAVPHRLSSWGLA